MFPAHFENFANHVPMSATVPVSVSALSDFHIACAFLSAICRLINVTSLLVWCLPCCWCLDCILNTYTYYVYVIGDWVLHAFNWRRHAMKFNLFCTPLIVIHTDTDAPTIACTYCTRIYWRDGIYASMAMSCICSIWAPESQDTYTEQRAE